MKGLDRETDLTMDLLIYDWNYLHGLRKRMLPKEDEKDAVGLLPLTSDSLEMLQT